MATAFAVSPRLMASIHDEPKQMLQGISGYEEEPLLSLEDTCKPLEKFLGKELKQNMVIAKANSAEPEDRLTPDESASIHLYTMEWKNSENSLYSVLNRTLRLADRRQLQPWFRYLKLFLTGFFKLPPTKYHTVWRSVPEDMSSFYPKGKEFTWWGISSCTSSISVLQSSPYAGMSDARTYFSIETNNGKLIRSHSYIQQQDEILLPPGIHLIVIDKSNSTDGINIIHLREISPPYKTLEDPFDLSQWKHTLPRSKPSSRTTVPQKKQENDPTANIARVEHADVTSKKKETEVKAPKKSTPYSREKLDCKGRACAKCGHCRDWYRSDDVKHGGMDYIKRDDAKCIGTFPYFLTCHTDEPDNWYDCYVHSVSRRKAVSIDVPLCQCEDNKSAL